MWDHCKEKHNATAGPDIENDYQFRITGVFIDALTREVAEAVRIIMAKAKDNIIDIDKREGAAKGGVIKNINRKDEIFGPYARKNIL